MKRKLVSGMLGRTSVACKVTLSAMILSAVLVAGPASTASAATPSLTVALPAADAAFAAVVVAQQHGYYKKTGVHVKVEITGLNTLSLVASKAVDLTEFGTGQALILANEGMPTSVVYSNFGNGEAAYVMVAANSPYTSLASLSGKRVGVLSVGGSSYGYGNIYSHYVASHGGSPFDIISFSSVTALIDSLESGQIDAGVAVASYAAPAIAAGQIKLLVDPREGSPVLKGVLGNGVAEGTMFGLRSDLRAKRKAVTRFMAAIDMAGRYLSKATPKQIAARIGPAPGFNALTVASLEAGAKYNKPFYSPNGGLITRTIWSSTLNSIANWGIPNVNAHASQFRFSNMVDMSYLLNARKLEKKLGVLK